MTEFYPPIEPYFRGYLKVSNLHELYYEQSGNPNGSPVVFLHGGPGGGTDNDHRRYFDPQHYRIILFDQRGCGKSKPNAEIRENSTWELVEDIEKIRKTLGLEKWVVFGGSWGSTLALSYAITYPQHVRALILRGIFLCRPEELKWFYQEGASWIFPDVWESYFNHIPASERHDLMKAYYARLTHENPEIRLEAAKIWSKWEAATSRLLVDLQSIDAFDEPEKALAFARIECHYFMNNAFFKTQNYILENVNQIKKIPGVIIQGRYDVVCPLKSAWELHKLWPEAELKIIKDSGHAASEPGIRAALIDATNQMKSL
jgi:proline iminopeptidase